MIAPPDPRSGWNGWGPRPTHDNQVGHRLPTGGQPATGGLPILVAVALFLASPLILLAWAASQALLRATGWRWWKLALAALGLLILAVAMQGGPGPALAHHFAGYRWALERFGTRIEHAPLPGALLWPQVPLSLPIGLLAAALNLAGRRQPFHPAEVRRQQRDRQRRLRHAVRRAGRVRDDHDQVPALGVAIDGDLDVTSRGGLVIPPWWVSERSRLIVGTSGMGKTVDVEREAFLAARAGRKLFLIDGKGTDPRFVERALAGYLLGHPHATAAMWPELAMDGWRGTPAAVHNRLMAMLGWSEPYYHDIASLLLRLALLAPSQDGPVRSFAQLLSRLDPEVLVRLYQDDPDRHREAASLAGREQARAVAGAVSRFANFAHAVGGGFDGRDRGWSFEDVDFAYLRAPYLAGREDADAACRLILEDFAHYATLRKPRVGEDVTLVFDEFSAITGGRDTAIQLVERVRDAGCALVLSAQSADGLGDEAQQRRLVGACAGGLLLHAMPHPHTLLRAAGVVNVVEQTWRLDPHGPTGNSSARIGERPKIDPASVQQAREGEAWLIARGRYQHLIVAQTTIPPAWQHRARAIVALGRHRRADRSLPGARSWTQAREDAGPAAELVERQLALPPPDDGQTTPVPGPVGSPPNLPQPATVEANPQQPAPPSRRAPVGPVDAAGWRLRLAVTSAARHGNASRVTAIVRTGPRHGISERTLHAVAQRYWPTPLPVRVARHGRHWLTRQRRQWWPPRQPSRLVHQREQSQ